MDYIKSEEGYQATNNLKLKRLKTHYSDLFPLNIPFEDKKEVLSFIKEEFRDLNFNSNYIVFCNKDILKPLILFGFIKLGGFQDYIMMNTYRLLDITLGKDMDYETIGQVYADYSILYSGYREFNNKRQSDVVEQYIEQMIMRGKKVWMYHKGSKQNFNRRYGGTLKLIKERGFEIINLDIPFNIKKSGMKGNSSSSFSGGMDEI